MRTRGKSLPANLSQPIRPGPAREHQTNQCLWRIPETVHWLIRSPMSRIVLWLDLDFNWVVGILSISLMCYLKAHDLFLSDHLIERGILMASFGTGVVLLGGIEILCQIRRRLKISVELMPGESVLRTVTTQYFNSPGTTNHIRPIHGVLAMTEGRLVFCSEDFVASVLYSAIESVSHDTRSFGLFRILGIARGLQIKTTGQPMAIAVHYPNMLSAEIERHTRGIFEVGDNWRRSLRIPAGGRACGATDGQESERDVSRSTSFTRHTLRCRFFLSRLVPVRAHA